MLFRPTMLPEVAQLGYAVCSLQTPRVIALYWTRPPVGTVKVHIDGSSLENPSQSEGGVVLRDSDANVIFATSCSFLMGSSFRAEILALKYALELCFAHHCSSFVVESDAKLMVDFC